MMLCLVTDRRRLGRAVGAPPDAWIELLGEQVRAAAGAGVELIQVREPDLEADALVALVRLLVTSVSGTAARILVNDRLDVAIAAGAAGVHLKERGFLPDTVRRLVPKGFVIGCSVHTVAAAAARRDADFLVAGTVLPTVSKPAVEYLDQAGLQQIVEAAAGKPVLGIGGLDVASVSILAASSAAGLAAVGAFIPSGAAHVSTFVQKRVAELRFALESASSGT